MSAEEARTDAATWHHVPVREPLYGGEERTSHYLTMRDGVRIAIDVYVPAGLEQGARIPTILQQTRYFRSVRYTGLARRLGIEEKLDQGRPGRLYFVTRGYAWVHVCARGSGASGGVRPYPWSDDEVADGGEVLDWIVAQGWSNGAVGSRGVSYDGTAAEMLLLNGHPALRAIAPRFSLYDVYADVAFPGGVHLSWFTELWGRFNAALDRNEHSYALAALTRHNLAALAQYCADRRQPVRAAGLRLLASGAVERVTRGLMKAVSRGVSPVDGAEDEVASALADHRANYDVHDGALRLVQRDDVGLSDVRPDDPIDVFSPHAYRERMQSAGVPIYSYSGWFDAAYPHAAIKRFAAVKVPGSRLILGPWDHGGGQNGSPHRGNHWAKFDHDRELLDFFDRYLVGDDDPRREGPRGEGSSALTDSAAPPVRYFTMGAERWNTSPTWPPAGCVPHTLYLGVDDRLSDTASARGEAGGRLGWISHSSRRRGSAGRDESEVGDRESTQAYSTVRRALSTEPTQESSGSAGPRPEVCETSRRTADVEWSPALGTGRRARWRTLLGLFPPVGYARPQARPPVRRVFVSEPLTASVEVTGHPIVHLRVSCSAPDAAVFAYLEDVAPDGSTTTLTEGCLRLLHRALARPPESELPVPERSFLAAATAPLPPGDEAEVVFDLLPTSYEFAVGHRIGLAVTLGDADHFRPVVDQPHTLHVHLDGGASRLVLPVMP